MDARRNETEVIFDFFEALNDWPCTGSNGQKVVTLRRACSHRKLDNVEDHVFIEGNFAIADVGTGFKVRRSFSKRQLKKKTPQVT